MFDLSFEPVYLRLDVVQRLVGVHVVVGALDHGMLRVGLVLVVPELALLPVVDDLRDVGYLGSQLDLRRVSSVLFRLSLICVFYLVDQELHVCENEVIVQVQVSIRLHPGPTIALSFKSKISEQGLQGWQGRVDGRCDSVGSRLCSHPVRILSEGMYRAAPRAEIEETGVEE